MTKDDIIKMARETGMELYGHGRDQTNFVFILCRFANEVAAAEREECAQLVEQAGIDGYGTLAAAAMIRARGQA
jgi:hypothetical protein